MSTYTTVVQLDRSQKRVVYPSGRAGTTGHFLTGIDVTGNLPKLRVRVRLDRQQNRVVEAK